MKTTTITYNFDYSWKVTYASSFVYKPSVYNGHQHRADAVYAVGCQPGGQHLWTVVLSPTITSETVVGLDYSSSSAEGSCPANKLQTTRLVTPTCLARTTVTSTSVITVYETGTITTYFTHASTMGMVHISATNNAVFSHAVHEERRGGIRRVATHA